MKHKTRTINETKLPNYYNVGAAVGCQCTAACRPCEHACRHSVEVPTLNGQHLPCRCVAVGHELLGCPDGKDGRRMAIHLLCRQNKRVQADTPTKSVDKRLRAVLTYAYGRKDGLRRGRTCQLVLAQDGESNSILLQRISCRLRRYDGNDSYRTCLHHAHKLSDNRRGTPRDRRIRQRLIH